MHTTLARVGSWRPWWQAVRGLIFPETCIVCGGAREVGPLCLTCAGQLGECQGPQCPRCALPIRPIRPDAAPPIDCPGCRRHPPRFDAAVSLGTYEGPLRWLCLRLKSARSGWLAPRLIDLLLAARGAPIRGWVGDSARAGRRPVMVVPIPLHWWRRWRRGVNQADTLAAVVADRLGLTVCRALRCARPTPHLARLSRTERKARLRGAFRVRKRWYARLAGRDVILVDDILTTGATCNAAAHALKRAGARRVYALLLARAKEPT